jgi:SAM-dependent methyltransferase
MDVWGEIFRDEWLGKSQPHVIERDDGVEDRFDSAAGYFRAPRSDAERELLDSLAGPVLDLGAGPGSHALYLQGRGVPVTAADASPGAVQVCRERGCGDARVMDMRRLRLDAARYHAIIIMGNTVGIHQSPNTLPTLLRTLLGALAPSGVILCGMADPLDTSDEKHLSYHQRNRERGLPPGLVKLRLKYKQFMEEWNYLWMPTRDELVAACAAAGCGLADERSIGHNRLRLIRAKVS